MRELNLIVVDTETGGFDPAKCCIIELAAAHISVNSAGAVTVYDRFHVRILPRLPVHPQAAAVNGYSEEKWANDALQLSVAASDFLKWLDEVPAEGLIWTGSNVTGFDLPFLRSDFAHVGQKLPGSRKFHRRNLNTESLCFPIYVHGETDGCGIAHLRSWAGLDGVQSHSAAGDVADTVEVIRVYFERLALEKSIIMKLWNAYDDASNKLTEKECYVIEALDR